MTKKFEYYEIKSPNDAYGLVGRFDTEEAALQHINYSYQNALRLGYDNSNENWMVVRVRVAKVFTDDGRFLKETAERFALYTAQYDFSDKAYVPVY